MLRVLARREEQVDARELLVEQDDVVQGELAVFLGHALLAYIPGRALLVLGDQAHHKVDVPLGLHQAHGLDDVAEGLRDAARRFKQQKGRALLDAVDDLAVLGGAAVHEDGADRAKDRDDGLRLEVDRVEDDVVGAAREELGVVEDAPDAPDDRPPIRLQVDVILVLAKDLDDALAHARVVRMGVDELHRTIELLRRGTQPREARGRHQPA